MNLPEGAVANASVTVTSFFNAEGVLEYTVATTGDAPTSTFLGLLEMAKHDLIEWASSSDG